MVFLSLREVLDAAHAAHAASAVKKLGAVTRVSRRKPM
jgi:hypothetical protein